MHHHPWRPQGLPLRVCEQGCPVSHPSIHSSKSNPAIHPSIKPLRVCEQGCHVSRPSMHPSIYPSNPINPSIHPSIAPARVALASVRTGLPCLASIHLSIHPSIHPSLHTSHTWSKSELFLVSFLLLCHCNV